MRTATHALATTFDPDDLLTTGEAAALLNSSRQHVVDLCDRGDLPFTTIGRHRRVRRADVEAIMTRTERLTRDQRRSLWLAYAIAGRIVEDPAHALSLANHNLFTMRPKARGEAKRWLDEWARLARGPVEELLDALTGRSLKSRELRQNAPFAGLLGEEERTRVLTAWKQHERR